MKNNTIELSLKYNDKVYGLSMGIDKYGENPKLFMDNLEVMYNMYLNTVMSIKCEHDMVDDLCTKCKLSSVAINHFKKL